MSSYSLWHLDFVHWHINRAGTFTLILLDDFSRCVPGHGVDDAERADLVIKTFEEAVERHGRPELVLHDKESALWSWRGISRFTTLLTELGIDQIAAEHKERNGKLEAFNANLHKDDRYLPGCPWLPLAQWQVSLPHFRQMVMKEQRPNVMIISPLSCRIYPENCRIPIPSAIACL